MRWLAPSLLSVSAITGPLYATVDSQLGRH